jgi:DNA polymerase-3 subunit delta
MSEAWTASKLQESLRKKDLYPLYFFYGDETFLIEEALHELIDFALGDSLRDFNLNTFYAADADASEIRDAIETLPMMAATRVVVLKEAQDFKDKEWEQLMPIIENPVESTTLICLANKLDKRKKHTKRFLDAGVVVEFKRPFENQIPDWIAKLARKQSLQVNREVVELLHQLIGNNLSDVQSELLKLSQYMGERQMVTPDDILAVISHVKIDSVFDLTSAIGDNDRARALDCLVNLLDHGQSEVGVLALISRHMRILKLVGDGQREGLTGGKLAARAGVSPYFLKQYSEQVHLWSGKKIEKTFQALLDTDRALKSSAVASHIWLENFIVQTCTS